MIRSDFYVYVYSYPNGIPFYVGKGCHARDKSHLREAVAGRGKDRFVIRVINKILESGCNPLVNRIIENVDNEFACFVEQEYIAKYGRRDKGTGILTNCTCGGDGVFDLAPETQSRINKSLLDSGKPTQFKPGHAPSPAAIANAKSGNNRRGKLHSEETKQRMSDVKRGRPSTRQDYSHNDETLAKIKQARAGQIWYNNGKRSILCHEGQQPEGFIKGRGKRSWR